MQFNQQSTETRGVRFSEVCIAQGSSATVQGAPAYANLFLLISEAVGDLLFFQVFQSTGIVILYAAAFLRKTHTACNIKVPLVLKFNNSIDFLNRPPVQ